MKWLARVVASAALLALSACNRESGGGTPAQTAAGDSAPVQAAAPDTAAPVEPAPAPVAVMPQADEPWSPVDTGTVAPGMSRDDVITVWGVPVAERVTGSRGYLYFRNGCEFSCGTFDVVMLENGQVVDAIVRGPGHTYAGTSSSPPGRQAAANIPPVPGQGAAE